MRFERWIYGMRMRLRALFRREDADRELDEELRYHIERKTEENIARGMDAAAARRAALIEAGGIDQAKEKCRDVRGVNWIHDFVQDVRFGLRMLRKNPGFALTAILTLALGIGANTAIFSVVNAVMLRVLPVKDPQQLVVFTWDDAGKWPPNFSQTGMDSKYSFSYPQFIEFQQRNQVLTDVFAFVPLGFGADNVTLSRNGDATAANATMISGNYFSGLGVTPLAGRTIHEADEQPGAPRVAVIGYAYWNSRFGRDPGVIGRNVAINGIPFTIVGVTPPGFFGEAAGGRPDLWIAFDDAANLRPWSARPSGSDSVYTARGWICLSIMGRLRPGVSREKAQAELNLTYRQILLEYWKPEREEDVPRFLLAPGAQGMPYLREIVAQPVLLTMGSVGVVLLIACANVATLLLARASTRGKETGVRLAMGASRGRLIRQMLTESMLLSFAGGALGFLLAAFGVQAMLALPTRGQFAIVLPLTPDWRVLLFTMAAALLTGIVFGLAPALRSSRMDLAAAMKESSPDIFGRGKNRMRHALVVLQVAGCMMLMVSAGLFVRTLANFVKNDFGFRQENLLTFGLDATRDGYQGERLATLYAQLLERIRSLPGVEAATTMEFPPFGSTSSNTNITLEGSPVKLDEPTVRWQTVGPGFFETMRIPIVLGRGIEEMDTSAEEKVAVVDDTFVKQYFGGENPIGHRFALGSRPKVEDGFEIVGVVKAAELTDVHATARPKAYFAYPQLATFLNSMYFEIRTPGNPEAVLSELREAVRQTDANLPLLSVETQTELRDDALTGERLLARFSAGFGLLALMLTVVGLYGTIAYSVARKTHEIGIRMALGAARSDVLWGVVAQGAKLAGVGIGVGALAALGATQLLRSLMFGVTPTDPATFLGVAALVLVVSIAASLIPARRAMRVDPMVALRHD
jgi:predicted permease